MEYQLLIPNISKKIEKVLASQKLKPEISPSKFIEKTNGKKHRYRSICFDKSGKKLVFYARLHKSDTEKARMLAEVRLAKIFSEGKINFFPHYLRAKIEESFEWLIKKYLPGRMLEDRKRIEKLIRGLKKEEILNISKMILEMQNLPPFSFLRKFETENYEKMVLKNVFNEEEIKKFEDLYKKNKEFLESENKYFTHGDLQIANIIIGKKGMKFVDLESAHLNNFAFDISYLSARLWQNKRERKELKKSFFTALPPSKKKIFPLLFRFSTFFIGYHSFMANPKEYSKKELKKRKGFYRNLMRASLESFESLMEF